MRAMEGDAQPLSIKGPEPQIVVRESSARAKDSAPDNRQNAG